MTILYLNDLQKAVFSLLSNDSILSGLVSGIYDHAPDGAAFPYVSFGDVRMADWSTKTTRGLEYEFELHAWSRNGGKRQCSLIMDVVNDVLQVGTIVTDHGSIMSMTLKSAEIERENDAITYRGTMQYRAYLQFNA